MECYTITTSVGELILMSKKASKKYYAVVDIGLSNDGTLTEEVELEGLLVGVDRVSLHLNDLECKVSVVDQADSYVCLKLHIGEKVLELNPNELMGLEVLLEFARRMRWSDKVLSIKKRLSEESEIELSTMIKKSVTTGK